MKKVMSILLGTMILASWSVSSAKDVYVRGYYKKEGTYVQPYVQSSTDQTMSDNYGSNSTAFPATQSGSVTLSWKAPSFDADGSILNDLAGYKIYYGISSMNYTQSVDVGRYTEAAISSLSPGGWCFSVTAYDASGNESKYSNEVCKTI